MAIIQGTTDTQVRVEDAELLKTAAPKSTLEIIAGMNHIFKASSADHQENIATYTNPDLPINQELVRVMEEFIRTRARE